MNFIQKHLLTLIVSASGLLVFTSTAAAIPITADITNFSVIHAGSNPAGTGDQADWLQFDPAQSIALDLSNNLITLVGTQSFTLTSQNGQVDQLDIVGFMMDLNDTDGFLGGTIDYVLGGTAGIFDFADQNYGVSPYNSSIFENGQLSLFIWGGDTANDIGLDLGMTATVPEPGVFALLLVGLAGMRIARRKIA